MNRIPIVDPQQLSAEQRKAYDAIAQGPRGGVRGPFLALLHVPALADGMQRLGEYLRYQTSFEPRLAEIAILVTARHCNCQYEFFAHARLALQAGVEQAHVDAIARRGEPVFADPDQALVYSYARELNAGRDASDATYAKVLKRFGTRGVVELTALCGYYTMMAMTLNAHRVPLPEGVVPPLQV